MSAPRAARGEVWLVDLDAGHGREQAGVRPVLVVSATELGSGPSGLAIVVPLTTTHRPTQPLHVAVRPPDGGTRRVSYAMTEQIRAVSRTRLMRRWGAVSGPTMARVEHRLRVVLDLV
ncbi:MAG: type II toxin-antitoxin system PemK/MazF family toxin [Actinomycetota bacterium]